MFKALEILQPSIGLKACLVVISLIVKICPFHRGVFCQFLFRRIFYCLSSKSTAKKTGKKHICVSSAMRVAAYLTNGNHIFL